MARKDFVPFFEKPNSERKTKQRQKTSFPNYMNWYVPKDAAHKEALKKNAYSFQSGSNRRPRQSDFSQGDREYQPIDRQRRTRPSAYQQPMADEALREENELMQKRRQRHQAIRKELEDYRNYQFRQPFKPTQVPSIWGNKDKSALEKDQSVQKASSSQNKAQRPKGNQIKDEKSNFANKRKRSKHLNRSFADIMDQERTGKQSQAFMRDFNRRREE